MYYFTLTINVTVLTEEEVMKNWCKDGLCVSSPDSVVILLSRRENLCLLLTNAVK